MKKLFFIPLVLGVALVGCNKATRDSTTSTDSTTNSGYTATTPTATTTETSVARSIDNAGHRASDSIARAGQSTAEAFDSSAARMSTTGDGMMLKSRISEWNLAGTHLQGDLNSGREIVRTRSDFVGAPTGKVDDDMIEKSIKNQLKADSVTSGLSLDVNADNKGAVELEGKARSADQIGHAIAVALNTEGVSRVTSKIKLDANAGR